MFKLSIMILSYTLTDNAIAGIKPPPPENVLADWRIEAVFGWPATEPAGWENVLPLTWALIGEPNGVPIGWAPIGGAPKGAPNGCGTPIGGKDGSGGGITVDIKPIAGSPGASSNTA